MQKKNLYIDFDGVILDTITPLYKDFEKLNDEDKEDPKKFFENYPWKEIIDDKYILNNAINELNEIIKSNEYNLAILTHVNSINEAVLKIKYLRRYFDDITIIPCPKEISKTQMIHTKQSILIDDYAGNLREWEAAGGIGIRFNTKGEEKGFKTINRLSQIINMF